MALLDSQLPTPAPFSCTSHTPIKCLTNLAKTVSVLALMLKFSALAAHRALSPSPFLVSEPAFPVPRCVPGINLCSGMQRGRLDNCTYPRCDFGHPDSLPWLVRSSELFFVENSGLGSSYRAVSLACGLHNSAWLDTCSPRELWDFGAWQGCLKTSSQKSWSQV